MLLLTNYINFPLLFRKNFWKKRFQELLSHSSWESHAPKPSHHPLPQGCWYTVKHKSRLLTIWLTDTFIISPLLLQTSVYKKLLLFFTFLFSFYACFYGPLPLSWNILSLSIPHFSGWFLNCQDFSEDFLHT